MPLEDLISTTISRLMRRLIRRGIAMAVFALFLLVALYHLTLQESVLGARTEDEHGRSHHEPGKADGPDEPNVRL